MFPGGGSHCMVIFSPDTEIGSESLDGSGHEVTDAASVLARNAKATLARTRHLRLECLRRLSRGPCTLALQPGECM